MTAHPELRQLLPGDEELFRRVRLEALAAFPPAFAVSLAEQTAQSDEEIRCTLESVIVLGAFMSGGMVGLGGLKCSPLEKHSHKASILYMFVSPRLQSRGLGRRLLDALLERVPPVIEQVALTVVVPNPGAVALYESMGFRHWGTEPRAVKINGQYFDEQYHMKMLR